MSDGIFGYAWTDIQRAQQGGRLAHAIDTSKAPATETPAADDLALLAEHGETGLHELSFFGVIDRLTRAGVLGGGLRG